MLKKRYIKTRNVAKITFVLSKEEIPAGIEVNFANLVGEFNNWDPTATPMKPDKQGTYSVTLELEPGRNYQFRYLINNEHWCNDWNADGFIASGLGVDNCLVITPEG